jgi:quinol monooxygenase YgiN
MPIAVIATLHINPGMEAQFETAFAPLQAAVNANEPGNRLYQLTRSAEAGLYKVLEIYDDQAAIDAHRASDHFKTLGAALGPCMAGRPDLERLETV